MVRPGKAPWKRRCGCPGLGRGGAVRSGARATRFGGASRLPGVEVLGFGGLGFKVQGSGVRV